MCIEVDDPYLIDLDYPSTDDDIEDLLECYGYTNRVIWVKCMGHTLLCYHDVREVFFQIRFSGAPKYSPALVTVHRRSSPNFLVDLIDFERSPHLITKSEQDYFNPMDLVPSLKIFGWI